MKCLFIFIIIILFMFIYSQNIYEGLKDHKIKNIENDPWHIYKRRDNDIIKGKQKRNYKYGLKDLFETETIKLFNLFDKNKDKIITNDELLSEESDFDLKFTDEYLRIFEDKEKINFHEFKQWHQNIISPNNDEYIICPQKEKDKPLNAIIHLKIFDAKLDPYDDIFVSKSEKQNELIKEIKIFTKNQFLKEVSDDIFELSVPDSNFKIEPSVKIIKLNPEDDRDPIKYKYNLPSQSLIVTYKIINIKKEHYDLILEYINKKNKILSFTINDKKNDFKDFILKIELLGLSHMYQKKNKQNKYSYTFDNHCEWNENNNDSLFQYYNSSCSPEATEDDPCWEKSIPLEKMDSPNLIDPLYPNHNVDEYKSILSYPLHIYPEKYIKKRFKNKLNDHEINNIETSVFSLFDLMDEHNDLLNDRLYNNYVR